MVFPWNVLINMLSQERRKESKLIWLKLVLKNCQFSSAYFKLIVPVFLFHILTELNQANSKVTSLMAVYRQFIDNSLLRHHHSTKPLVAKCHNLGPKGIIQ
jgi:hypothetical protein